MPRTTNGKEAKAPRKQHNSNPHEMVLLKILVNIFANNPRELIDYAAHTKDYTLLGASLQNFPLEQFPELMVHLISQKNCEASKILGTLEQVYDSNSFNNSGDFIKQIINPIIQYIRANTKEQGKKELPISKVLKNFVKNAIDNRPDENLDESNKIFQLPPDDYQVQSINTKYTQTHFSYIEKIIDLTWKVKFSLDPFEQKFNEFKAFLNKLSLNPEENGLTIFRAFETMPILINRVALRIIADGEKIFTFIEDTVKFAESFPDFPNKIEALIYFYRLLLDEVREFNFCDSSIFNHCVQELDNLLKDYSKNRLNSEFLKMTYLTYYEAKMCQIKTNGEAELISKEILKLYHESTKVKIPNPSWFSWLLSWVYSKSSEFYTQVGFLFAHKLLAMKGVSGSLTKSAEELFFKLISNCTSKLEIFVFETQYIMSGRDTKAFTQKLADNGPLYKELKEWILSHKKDDKAQDFPSQPSHSPAPSGYQIILTELILSLIDNDFEGPKAIDLNSIAKNLALLNYNWHVLQNFAFLTTLNSLVNEKAEKLINVLSSSDPEQWDNAVKEDFVLSYVLYSIYEELNLTDQATRYLKNLNDLALNGTAIITSSGRNRLELANSTKLTNLINETPPEIVVSKSFKTQMAPYLRHLGPESKRIFDSFYASYCSNYRNKNKKPELDDNLETQQEEQKLEESKEVKEEPVLEPIVSSSSAAPSANIEPTEESREVLTILSVPTRNVITTKPSHDGFPSLEDLVENIQHGKYNNVFIPAKLMHLYFKYLQYQESKSMPTIFGASTPNWIINDKHIAYVEGDQNSPVAIGKNCYALINENIKDKLKTTEIKDFYNALRKGFVRSEGESGVKILDSTSIEIKLVTHDQRLIARGPYTNDCGKLYIFNTLANHEEVKRQLKNKVVEIPCESNMSESPGKQKTVIMLQKLKEEYKQALNEITGTGILQLIPNDNSNYSDNSSQPDLFPLYDSYVVENLGDA